jgi:glycosyltransferase involved in cell wall biosynthesis
VASTSGGGSEAVNDGETGLLVPPNDVAATVRALDAILGDPALRQRMSAAGLRRVSDYFQMDRYVERVVAVYEKAIAMSKQLPDSFKDQTDWQTPRRPGATGGEPS